MRNVIPTRDGLGGRHTEAGNRNFDRVHEISNLGPTQVFIYEARGCLRYLSPLHITQEISSWTGGALSREAVTTVPQLALSGSGEDMTLAIALGASLLVVLLSMVAGAYYVKSKVLLSPYASRSGPLLLLDFSRSWRLLE